MICDMRVVLNHAFGYRRSKTFSDQKYFVSSDIHLCRPIGLGQHSGTNSVCKFPLIILRFADNFLVTSIVSREGPKFYRIFYRSVEEEGEQNDSLNSYFPLFLAAMKNLLRFIAILYQVIHIRRPKTKSIFSFKECFHHALSMTLANYQPKMELECRAVAENAYTADHILL